MKDRIKLLPHWCLCDNDPAFYDTESKTAIGETALVYKNMQKLIDEYNKFADEINLSIEKFVSDSNITYEQFKNEITKTVHDYIITIDSKIAHQDRKIEEALENLQSIETNTNTSIEEINTAIQDLQNSVSLIINESLKALSDDVEEIKNKTVAVSCDKPTNGELVWFRKSKNIYNGKYKLGYFVNGSTDEELLVVANGTINSYTTDWLPCKPNTSYVLSYWNDEKLISSEKRRRWQTKDDNGNITFLNNGSYNVTTDENAKYLRCYYYQDEAKDLTEPPKIMIEEGTAPSSKYEEIVNKSIFVKDDNGEYVEYAPLDDIKDLLFYKPNELVKITTRCFQGYITNSNTQLVFTLTPEKRKGLNLNATIKKLYMNIRGVNGFVERVSVDYANSSDYLITTFNDNENNLMDIVISKNSGTFENAVENTPVVLEITDCEILYD